MSVRCLVGRSTLPIAPRAILSLRYSLPGHCVITITAFWAGTVYERETRS